MNDIPSLCECGCGEATIPEHGKQPFMVPVNDAGRLGIRFPESGRVVYLTGDVDENVVSGRDELEDERNGVDPFE